MQDRVEARFARLFLREDPRRGLVDVLVRAAHQDPDRLERHVELELVHLGLDIACRIHRDLLEFVVDRFADHCIRHDAAVVFLDHRDRAADEVAQVVRQVVVQSLQKDFVGEDAVLPEGVLAQQEVLQRVDAVAVDQDDRIHDIALGLAHLAAVDQQPAVAEDLLRDRLIDAHEHRRPDDAVESHDLLAHQVDARPVLLVEFRFIRIAQRRDIVAERIEPDVDDVLLINRHRDAPVEAGAGDAQIVQPLFDERDHLIAAGFRFEELRILFEVLEQSVCVFADLEEVRFFLCLFHRAAAVGAFAVDQLALRPERLAGRAVQAFILAFVDVALLVHLHEDFLDALDMAFLGGADEVVIGDLHGRPQILDACDDFVDILLRRDAGLFRLLLDLLAVLIGAGQKSHIVPQRTLEPGHRVRHDGAVRMPDVQVVTGVIDRCRNIIRSFIFTHCILLSAAGCRRPYSPLRLSRRST